MADTRSSKNFAMVFAFIAAYLVIAAVFYYVVLKTAVEVKDTLSHRPALELVEGGTGEEVRRVA